ncbi:MAG: cytochrome c biogenesis protein ResB [Betaproteobacteria bacterium]|nr:cytochrome c biogenesis protein ResB [Betaproteobacteria bacterium]
MRFAISLLTILAIASVIGTVLKQNQPYPNYAFEFGPFWFSAFKSLGLYDVYHSGWFLVILFFLVASTSLCLYRNTPLMLREMRSFRTHAQESSLRLFAHREEYAVALPRAEAVGRLTRYLQAQRFRFRVVEQATPEGESTLVAAKSGSFNRLGYILTHAAIVVICLGGLIDGDVPLRVQELTGSKVIETQDIPVSQVPAASRLPSSHLSFRGNVNVPEGSSADVIFQTAGPGYLVQELPFDIVLKKFRIEHYPTGQPKMFESDVELVDKATGRTKDATITVNHPVAFDGATVYQASFADGGSGLSMRAWNLFAPDDHPFAVQGNVNAATPVSADGHAYSAEFTNFRMFNVENLGHGPAPGHQSLSQDLRALSGAAVDRQAAKPLTNVGPSFEYKLRDAQGQAREYDNYMRPVVLDGRPFLLSGVRSSPSQPFTYLRFPVDSQGSIQSFMALRAVLFDPALYPAIAKRVVAITASTQPVTPSQRAQLIASTQRVLKLFSAHGYDAVAQFINRTVPKANQGQAAHGFFETLQWAAFEAYQLARERAGKPDAPADDAHVQFVQDSLDAIADSFYYGAPVYLQLTHFHQVQASGFQVTRSPGKYFVFGGSALLVLGIFAMFFIRERRIWLLAKEGELLFAMSGNRRTLDFEREFARHRERIAALLRR